MIEQDDEKVSCSGNEGGGVHCGGEYVQSREGINQLDVSYEGDRGIKDII